MGTSTNAILFYGIGYTQEDQRLEPPGLEEDYDSYEWDYAWAELNGVDPNDYEARKKAAAEAAVEVGSHCYIDASMLYVALQGTVQMAWRGSVVNADVTLSCSKEEADEKIKNFCEKMGLEYTEPAWRLVSYWG